MPRDLADVLHYFLPELDAPEREAEPGVAARPTETPPVEETAPRAQEATPGAEATPPALPILGLPLGDRDVVRSAFAWNLAIETSRLGATAILLAPDADRSRPLWPELGLASLGCELAFCPAKGLKDLYETASSLARVRGATAQRGGLVFVRIPPSWLDEADALPDTLRWALLMSSPRAQDLEDTLALAHRLVARQPSIEIGVTIHGVSTIDEARLAFESLNLRARTERAQDLISYGLLVDDLHVYRAIAAQRPIGLAHPQAPATRALTDVARLVYEDARSRVLG